VTPQLVEGVVATLAADSEADGAIAAVPIADTVKQIANAESSQAGANAESSQASAAKGTKPTLSPSEGLNVGFVVAGTLDRGRLWAAQTPQVFRTEALRRALAAYPADAPAATDEAMLVEAAGGRVLIHPAPPENVKVTTPFDLRVAEHLLAGRWV
jgi:2-C-methyl-D-erythritol 4-phosphate cytidylyltransferase